MSAIVSIKEDKDKEDKDKEDKDKEKKAKKKRRRWIDRTTLAEKLNCHPMSIPRFEKTKPDFPKPRKPYGPMGKTMYDEDEADSYVEKVFAPVEVVR